MFCKLNIFQKQIFNKTLYNKPENKHNSKLVTIWYLAFCYQSRREECIAFEVWIIKPKKIKYQQFIHCGFEGEDMGWLKESGKIRSGKYFENFSLIKITAQTNSSSWILLTQTKRLTPWVFVIQFQCHKNLYSCADFVCLKYQIRVH